MGILPHSIWGNGQPKVCFGSRVRKFHACSELPETAHFDPMPLHKPLDFQSAASVCVHDDQKLREVIEERRDEQPISLNIDDL